MYIYHIAKGGNWPQKDACLKTHTYLSHTGVSIIKKKIQYFGFTVSFSLSEIWYGNETNKKKIWLSDTHTFMYE